MLTIEKVVKLLSAEYLAIFRQYLTEIQATKPLRLIDVIDKTINVAQDSDALCVAVYGDANKQTKQKFFQLAHHSFRLTAFLSRNYPSYLHHNINTIQQNFNDGKPTHANYALDLLTDVADKIGDRSTLNNCYSMLAHQQTWLENYNDAVRYHELIDTNLRIERKINHIYLQLRRYFNPKTKGLSHDEIRQSIQFYTSYFEDENVQVRLLSYFGYCFIMQQSNMPEFFLPETFEKIVAVEQEYRKNEYLIFPYLEDIQHKIIYLKLRYLFYNINTEALVQEADRLLDHSENFLFWKSFIPIPAMFATSVHASYYVTHYMTSYRHDHLERLPDDVIAHITRAKEKCKEIIDGKYWDSKNFLIRQINIRTVYSGLLMLGDAADIRKATEILEETLVVFQQIPFHTFLDGIFANLLCSYFCMGEHDKVAINYKRYKKIMLDKATNPENDLTLHGIYYCSQWIATNRKQYITKLEGVIEKLDAPHLLSTKNMLTDMAVYYEMPIQQKIM